jgi:hypothetical protein
VILKAARGPDDHNKADDDLLQSFDAKRVEDYLEK